MIVAENKKLSRHCKAHHKDHEPKFLKYGENPISNIYENFDEFLKNSKFEKRDQKTQQVVGYIEWTGDSDILFEGADTTVYKPDNSPCKVDFNVKEDFAYLFVGHWMQGQMGEDRKNVGY